MFEAMGVVATFAPLIMILWLANLGEKLRERGVPHMAPVVVSYLFLIMIYLFFFLVGFVMLLLQLLLPTRPDLVEQLALVGFQVDQITSWGWMTWGVMGASIGGLVLLLKPVRRLCARFTSLDPDNPVHGAALSMTMLIVINMAFTLGVGIGTLAQKLADQAEEGAAPPVSLAMLWTQAALFVVLALIGVGWLSRRSFGAALARLGIVRPTLREVLIGVGVALALVPLVVLIEALGRAVGVGVGQDIESFSEQLLGPLFASPLGVLSVGVAAAVGEESIFRGALQPKAGLWLTALLFALTHSNYGISTATVVVFILGVVLGLLRQRHNTTTAMITHAVYNSTLAGMAFLAAQYLAQQK